MARQTRQKMQVDDGVGNASVASAGGESNPLGTFLASLKASLSDPESAKAEDDARNCFVRQRVEAGCPKAEAEQEAV